MNSEKDVKPIIYKAIMDAYMNGELSLYELTIKDIDKIAGSIYRHLIENHKLIQENNGQNRVLIQLEQ
jgi:hypothetical protein